MTTITMTHTHSGHREYVSWLPSLILIRMNHTHMSCVPGLMIVILLSPTNTHSHYQFHWYW